jgi:antitoxin component YwqK of YwqJK toxin-antitoxin module
MIRMPSSALPKLLLIGLLCANLACAGASGPKPTPAAPPTSDAQSSDSSASSTTTASSPTPPPSDSTATTASTDPAPAAQPDPEPKKKKKHAASNQAQRVRQNDIARRAEAGLESMIIGTVIGAQLGGPIGAAAGAGLFGLWGLITGDVPFDSGRRSAPASHPSRGSDEEMENEVDDELKKQQDLEAEIEAELKHQEELLAAINKQEEVNKTLQQEAKDCAGSASADATAAPKRPCQREIPDSIFETKTVKEGKQERIVKTLDADRDGRPEIKITIDPKSGRTLTREEDTDFDGTLDSVNAYLPDGRLASRAEDTNQDGKPDRWLTYDGGETAIRVEVDRNFDGTRDGFLQYQGGVLAFEEYDNNGDGKIDRRIEYVAGKRSVEIEDTTLDGVMDARTYFDDRGLPTRVERDKNQDGKPDVFEYYEGSDATHLVLVKREEDTNGDGVVDVTSYYEKGKLVRKEVADPSLVN